MKSELRTRILALVIAIILSFTSVPALADEFPNASEQGPVTAMEMIEALYSLDNKPLMLESIIDDGTYATCIESAETWADAYDILPNGLALEEEITQADMAMILYNYAEHHDIDVDLEAAALHDDQQEAGLGEDTNNAVDWAVANHIISVNDENGFDSSEHITSSELSDTLENYERADLATVGVVADGLTLLYPSENQMTISPLCDFYVIGDIADTVTVPNDAMLTVRVIDSSGNAVREIYTNIKDNQDGMYVDYPGINISGDREAFRASLMPDLVYDPANPDSFRDTWIKACYSDEHYTSVVYGGSYHQDINPVDQYGQTLDPIPEGDYDLTVTLTSGEETLASLSTQITIGVIAKKAITRFSPTSYKNSVAKYCEERGIVVFLDPYPGYWNTSGFMPDWGTDFTGEILKRWVLVDREGYIGGMTCLFDYNISQTSTSYRVELGQIGYDKMLEDMDSMTYYYYDIGEPVIKQQGEIYEGNFVMRTLDNMTPVVFTRADHSTIQTQENYISPSVLENTTSEFDLDKRFVVNPGEIVSLNGICQVIQPDAVTFLPETEAFAMGNRIAGIRYTIRTATGEVYETVEREVSGLNREFEEGYTSTSILEFRHNFTITEDMRGHDMRIFAEALDEFGNTVGKPVYGCMFRVPRK